MIARTADRALQIFELYAERLEPLTLSQLAKALEMPVSSCSNLIRTLQARGYLYEVGSRKAYYPTTRWLVKSQEIAKADPVADRVLPHLQKLRDDIGETAILAKQLGDQVIHLMLVHSPHAIRYSGQPGDMKAFHTSSSGKAILGTMALQERTELVGRLKLSRGTPFTITQRKELLANVADGIRRGWWSTRGESYVDVMAVAAPVLLGSEIYTITMAGPVSRMDPILEKISKRILAVCTALAKGK